MSARILPGGIRRDAERILGVAVIGLRTREPRAGHLQLGGSGRSRFYVS
jgi:hypothetical protein